MPTCLNPRNEKLRVCECCYHFLAVTRDWRNGNCTSSFAVCPVCLGLDDEYFLMFHNGDKKFADYFAYLKDLPADVFIELTKRHRPWTTEAAWILVKELSGV